METIYLHAKLAQTWLFNTTQTSQGFWVHFRYQKSWPCLQIIFVLQIFGYEAHIALNHTKLQMHVLAFGVNMIFQWVVSFGSLRVSAKVNTERYPPFTLAGQINQTISMSFSPIYNARVQRLVNHLCLYKVNTHGPSCKCVFVHVLPGFRQQGGILVWRGGFRKVVKDS